MHIHEANIAFSLNKPIAWVMAWCLKCTKPLPEARVTRDHLNVNLPSYHHGYPHYKDTISGKTVFILKRVYGSKRQKLNLAWIKAPYFPINIKTINWLSHKTITTMIMVFALLIGSQYLSSFMIVHSFSFQILFQFKLCHCCTETFQGIH